jgi:hypothetical protein
VIASADQSKRGGHGPAHALHHAVSDAANGHAAPAPCRRLLQWAGPEALLNRGPVPISAGATGVPDERVSDEPPTTRSLRRPRPES